MSNRLQNFLHNFPILQGLTSELWTIAGDVLLSAASVSYFGPLQKSDRASLMQLWLSECDRNKIPYRNDFRCPSKCIASVQFLRTARS